MISVLPAPLNVSFRPVGRLPVGRKKHQCGAGGLLPCGIGPLFGSGGGARGVIEQAQRQPGGGQIVPLAPGEPSPQNSPLPTSNL